MSNSKRVCVIEDNLPIRKLFKAILKKSDFEVFDFDNAKDGIEWLKTTTPNIIILDILLPEISGLDAIKIIRNLPNYADIPIIAVTGFAADTDKEKYIQAGFNHYISKPVNVSTFGQEVSSLLN